MNRKPLRCAVYLGILGACAMLLTLAYAVWRGDFRAEGYRMLEMSWGQAALLDVYIGLALFCGWVFFRERRPFRAITWTVAILAAGNLATCCYVLWAAVTSRDNQAKFWMGENDEI